MRNAIGERRILMHGESNRGPGEAVCRWPVRICPAQPIQTFSRNRFLCVGQSKKRDSCSIDLRNQSVTEDDSVAGVPTASRTRSIAQHVLSQLNSIQRFGPTTRSALLERDD